MFEKKISDEAVLVLLGAEHAEEYFALIDANRKRLRRWFLWVDENKTPDDTRNFILDAWKRWAERGDVVAGIRYQGRIAGYAGLENVNMRLGTAELAYLIGEEFEGKGLVTLACKALLAHAFDGLGLNRVQIRVEPANERSKAVAIRLGGQYEGTLRQAARLPHGFEDLEVYSILRQEWAG